MKIAISVYGASADHTLIDRSIENSSLLPIYFYILLIYNLFIHWMIFSLFHEDITDIYIHWKLFTVIELNFIGFHRRETYFLGSPK